MELQDLPLELFQRIIDHTVELCGAPESLRFRQVSPLFASQILDSIILRQPLDLMFACRGRNFGGPKGQQLAAIYGGAILAARLSNMTNEMSHFLRGVLDNFFKLKPPSSEIVRRRQVREFCDAVVAQGEWAQTFARFNTDDANERQSMRKYLSYDTCSRSCVAAAAAAVGDLHLLQSLGEGTDNIFDNPMYDGSILPDPLHAGAATGKLDVIKWCLDLIQGTQRGLDPVPLTQIRRSRRRLKRALPIAIRMSQPDATLLIADLLFSWMPRHWHKYDTSEAVIEAIRYGKDDLLVELLSRRLASDPERAQRNATGIKHDRLVLTTSEIEFLFSEGSPNTLKCLLENGSIHPDGLQISWLLFGSGYSRPDYPVTLSITHALRGKRRDLVRVLIDKGADINVGAGRTTECGFRSPLQEAVEEATTPASIHDVQFLIEQGADPATVREGPLLALEHCCIAARYLKNASARPDTDKWHELWQTERNGRLKPLWTELEKLQVIDSDWCYLSPVSPIDDSSPSSPDSPNYLGMTPSPEESEEEVECTPVRQPVDMAANPDPTRRAFWDGSDSYTICWFYAT